MGSSKFAVCPRCEGTGTIVNPSIDGNGLSAEDFEEQGEDFREDYFAGVYDVRCPECGGNRVVAACKGARATARSANGSELARHERSGSACGQPVVEGSYVGWDEKERLHTTCYEHMSEDAREYVDDAARYAEEVAAERRMGA